MRILVTGTGRSGTCLLVEIPRGLDAVVFSKAVEDRKFFKYKTLPENYGTKLVTEHPTFTMKNMISFMERYEDLRLIFSLRHPVDIFMSKIRRGQKASDGGDRTGEWIADDATVESAIAVTEDFYEKYSTAVAYFPTRVMAVKLEDVIFFPEKTVQKIADWLGVKTTERAHRFYQYDRNKYHEKRYCGRIDSSQVGLHKHWKIVYGGFFKDRATDIQEAINHFSCIIKEWGYDDAFVG